MGLSQSACIAARPYLLRLPEYSYKATMCSSVTLASGHKPARWGCFSGQWMRSKSTRNPGSRDHETNYSCYSTTRCFNHPGEGPVVARRKRLLDWSLHRPDMGYARQWQRCKLEGCCEVLSNIAYWRVFWLAAGYARRTERNLRQEFQFPWTRWPRSLDLACKRQFVSDGLSMEQWTAPWWSRAPFWLRVVLRFHRWTI